jgi:hypothetical protein
MILRGNPNGWSCILASVAMVLDWSTKELIEEIGHDGSEVIFPDLPEPAKRRGFHIQEFVPLILKSGFSATAIFVLPCSTPDGNHFYDVPIKDPEVRFRDLVGENVGIFTGIMHKWHHAVAWDGYRIYDPSRGICFYDECELQIDCFYRFDRIKSS